MPHITQTHPVRLTSPSPCVFLLFFFFLESARKSPTLYSVPWMEPLSLRRTSNSSSKLLYGAEITTSLFGIGNEVWHLKHTVKLEKETSALAENFMASKQVITLITFSWGTTYRYQMLYYLILQMFAFWCVFRSCQIYFTSRISSMTVFTSVVTERRRNTDRWVGFKLQGLENILIQITQVFHWLFFSRKKGKNCFPPLHFTPCLFVVNNIRKKQICM